MNKNKHIYAIKNILYSGPITDDARYPNALIEHFLNIVRAQLVKQRLDKYQSIPESSYQNICMPMIHSELSECSACLNLPSDCKLLRSKYPIPKLLSDRWGEVLKVRTFDGKEIGFLNISSSRYSQYAETTDSFFFLFDNYVFVVGEDIKAVLISGLFEEPDEVSNYNICNDQGEEQDDPCYSGDSSYPLDINLAPIAYKMVIELLMPYAFIPDDKNNAEDDTAAMVKPTRNKNKS